MSNTNNLPATVAADAATVDATVATVAAAYFSANTVAPSDIATVIDSIRNSLTGKVEEPVVELTPAVSVKKSVTPDFIICLEDGKKLKMLKRHLKSTYNMTPDEYRAKWGLPNDYPMVAPNYAKQRSALAKQIGLGTKHRTEAAAA